MTRIQVNNIVIDGDKISVNDQVLVPGQAQTRPMQSQSLVPVRPMQMQRVGNMRALPTPVVSPSVFMTAGGITLLLAPLFFLLAYMSAMVPISAPIAITGLGAGLLALGIDRKRSQEQKERDVTFSEQQELRPHLNKLKELLANPNPVQTVEWIVEQSGLSEDIVIRCLALLQKKQALQEELSVETGSWHYWVSNPERMTLNENLASRMKQLE